MPANTVQKLRRRAYFLYGIQLFILAFGWFVPLAINIPIFLIGLILSYLYKEKSVNTKLKSHFQWCLKFFIALPLSIILAGMLGLGLDDLFTASRRDILIVFVGVVLAYLLYRIVRGLVLLWVRRPETAPIFVRAVEVAPFGFAIGAVTRSDVKEALSVKQVSITDHQSADAAQFEVLGDGLGIEGLRKTRFAFDSEGKLVSVFLEIGKECFKDIRAQIEKKYTKIFEFQYDGGTATELRSGEVAIFLRLPFFGDYFSVEYSLDTFIADSVRAASQKREQQQEKYAAKL